MVSLTRGQRAFARFVALAALNGGVYVVYVRAIRRARASGVQGTLHSDGVLNYDRIVVDSYRNYAGELGEPKGERESGGVGEDAV